MEFSDIQLKETRQALEELNKQHQQMVEAMTKVQEVEKTKDLAQNTSLFTESPSKSQKLE